jgi:hypothetical protein
MKEKTMRLQASEVVDPAAYDLVEFIQKSKVDLAKMPIWEKQSLSFYIEAKLVVHIVQQSPRGRNIRLGGQRAHTHDLLGAERGR